MYIFKHPFHPAFFFFPQLDNVFVKSLWAKYKGEYPAICVLFIFIFLWKETGDPSIFNLKFCETCSFLKNKSAILCTRLRSVSITLILLNMYVYLSVVILPIANHPR